MYLDLFRSSKRLSNSLKLKIKFTLSLLNKKNLIDWKDFFEFVIIPSEKLKLINFDKNTKIDKNFSSAYFVAPKGSSEFLIIIFPNNLQDKTDSR